MGQGTTGTDRDHGIEPDRPVYATAGTLAAWQEITDTAWDHGIEPDDSRTPRKAAARVVRLGQLEPDAAAAVHRVAGAVEQVLYAPEPRVSTGLAEDVETVRAGLRASAVARPDPGSRGTALGRSGGLGGLGPLDGVHRQVDGAVGPGPVGGMAAAAVAPAGVTGGWSG